MRAFRLPGWQQEARFEDVPVPDPGPGEVLVRIGGAGACHSDLHLMEWPEGTVPLNPPFTLGHENAGWVAATAPGVSDVEEGEAVAIYGPWGCGRCRNCRQGMENYCELTGQLDAMGGGLGRDGGMAPYMLVPDSRLLVSLHDLDPVVAAPLTDAALTPYHAIVRSRENLRAGSTAVVIGVGGLGHMAVQILQAISPAMVVAIDLDPDALALAERSGAQRTLTSNEKAPEAVREITDGRGAELVLDFVGNGATLAMAAQMTSILGELTLVGLGDGSLDYSFFTLPYECRLTTTYWGSVTELGEVLELARSGAIEVQIERFALEDATEVYGRLREGSLHGRAVIVPEDL